MDMQIENRKKGQERFQDGSLRGGGRRDLKKLTFYSFIVAMDKLGTQKKDRMVKSKIWMEPGGRGVGGDLQGKKIKKNLILYSFIVAIETH